MDQTTGTQNGSFRSHFPSGSWLLGALFSLGVAFLFVILLRSVSDAIAPSPTTLPFAYPLTDTKERCAAAGGTWEESAPLPLPPGLGGDPAVQDAHALGIGGTCVGPLRFEREQQAQRAQVEHVYFLVHAIGGGTALLAGLLLLHVTRLSTGLLLGGVLALWALFNHLGVGSELGADTGVFRLVAVVIVLLVVGIVGDFVWKKEHSHPPA